MDIKSVLLGKPLKNSQLSHEKLSRLWGLPIMASDAVSSVAYAIEEVLLVLVPLMGVVACNRIPFIVMPILILLIILIVSYSQIIDHYPNGGGAYAVAKENIGKNASLITASALVVDYILTVAVSISSSTEALSSAFPFLHQHKVMVSLFFVFLITLGNLRGISESSKIFGLPTYIFILSMLSLIVVGVFKLLTGQLDPISYPATVLPAHTVSNVSMLIMLRAFASGCTAMTGVEAVSNSVPSFKEPSTRNAKHILYMLGAVIVVIFGGTSFLAYNLKVIPTDTQTVLSQMANAVFGHNIVFYIIQLFTAIILILAANTAYNGLPQLLYILAHDGFVPRQFSSRGTKLSFSNGIVFIFVAACLLIIGFDSDTHKLIPLYSVGVFISFTIAQYGMFKKWRTLKEKNWQYKCWINGFGAVVTCVIAIIELTTKFAKGAWMLVIVLPALFWIMNSIHKHYGFIGQQLKLDSFYPYYNKEEIGTTKCVLLVHDINKPFLKALNYANSISTDITAVHVCRHPEHAESLRNQWKELKIPVKLTIIETPYRDIIKPLDDYLWQQEKELKHGENISVILIKFVSNLQFDRVLHNQTTYFIGQNMSKHKNVSTVFLPFHYKFDEAVLEKRCKDCDQAEYKVKNLDK